MTMIVMTNSSTLVSDSDVALMARACHHQLRYHAAPLWGKHSVPVVFLPAASLQYAPAGAWVLNVLDDSDQADALGWHTEDQGDVIYGRVFARPVLDNGGDALTKGLSVASVASHEALEIFGDPDCNLWADNGNDQLVALELADPVESDSYAIEVAGTAVTVSNFVTPHWFNINARPDDRFDWMSNVHGPFQMTHGGYVIKMAGGQVTQDFGSAYPDWRRQTKRADTARSARRH